MYVHLDTAMFYFLLKFCVPLMDNPVFLEMKNGFADAVIDLFFLYILMSCIRSIIHILGMTL